MWFPDGKDCVAVYRVGGLHADDVGSKIDPLCQIGAGLNLQRSLIGSGANPKPAMTKTTSSCQLMRDERDALFGEPGGYPGWAGEVDA